MNDRHKITTREIAAKWLEDNTTHDSPTLAGDWEDNVASLAALLQRERHEGIATAVRWHEAEADRLYQLAEDNSPHCTERLWDRAVWHSQSADEIRTLLPEETSHD